MFYLLFLPALLTSPLPIPFPFNSPPFLSVPSLLFTSLYCPHVCFHSFPSISLPSLRTFPPSLLSVFRSFFPRLSSPFSTSNSVSVLSHLCIMLTVLRVFQIQRKGYRTSVRTRDRSYPVGQRSLSRQRDISS